jgi:hypothetical protein
MILYPTRDVKSPALKYRPRPKFALSQVIFWFKNLTKNRYSGEAFIDP